MENTRLYFGDSLLSQNVEKVELETVHFENEHFFKINNYDAMSPFFMTIVSDSDFWMFISSTGGLTTGRKSPDHALFPYETDDKIHDSCETTGAHTIMIVTIEDKNFVWKPFSKHHAGVYLITRNLYKNTIGNKIMFEELNHSLNVGYRYTWKTSQQYGFIKESEVINTDNSTKTIKVLDGIRNILPYGVNSLLQTTYSTLADGYKRCELVEAVGLGLYTLSSIISDKAEPSESLKATTVWSQGLEHPTYLLSEQQVQAFCINDAIETEHDVKGRRGAFYVSDSFELTSEASKKWIIVSELNQSATRVTALIKEIKENRTMIKRICDDVLEGDKNLRKLVFDADGFQLTANQRSSFRHFSNTLFNIMRGGIYANGYHIETKDLKQFIANWNRTIFEKHRGLLNNLEETIHYNDLLDLVKKLEDQNLERLVLEYLPLTYSRRHGDPSRPWNKFSIEISQADGEKKLNFEGNWRDIFQNWEALSVSYPLYTNSIISKFVNASTADGYNPYRITKEGIDWEVLDPKDPWSNIGYWGDHQIIYLLKLMELSYKFNSEKLVDLLQKDIFVYANMPYRIKGFDELVKDPRNTITFDEACEALVKKRVSEIGSDGKLIFVDQALYHVNLMEKLLVVLLSKLSNFVPEGGIWMNTQRPEWNDANNALVGNGISMVTLYYLHRFLGFMSLLVEDMAQEIHISSEVHRMFERIFDVLISNEKHLGMPISDENRYTVVSNLGLIGQEYRDAIYMNGFDNSKKNLSSKVIKEFIAIAMSHLKDTIIKNKREDGLYHAYNLITFKNHSCSVSYLYEMLEGQVAVLSSKALETQEMLSVLKALRESAIYREDQNSYMLYPNRALPKFLSKNIIPEEMVMGSQVLKTEVLNGLNRFIEKDINGIYHFNGRFRNGEEIMEAISWTQVYGHADVVSVGAIFSALFNHHSFTGRSGTFYKYEGLGCIYWHMVSKLVVSTQESFETVMSKDGLSEEALALAHYFQDIKAGIGAEKSPVDYGAFPTDAYSHTPGFAGVQQPGMTGQVKEDFIARYGELGVHVIKGEIAFEPYLLSRSEFLADDRSWELPSETIELKKNQLGFTFGSVPIIYSLNDEKEISVQYKNGVSVKFENTSRLNKELSSKIFNRDGEIAKILVNIDRMNLR
jgi:hypothetical protein